MTIDIAQYLKEEAETLLSHTSNTIDSDLLHLPGPDFVDRVIAQSDRSAAVLRNLQSMFNTGRLAGTGYLTILPVDQGIEHSAGSAFAPNPIYFDPDSICRLAVDAECNAVASTLGVLGMVCRKYAHRIPFIAKINHNELLSYPNSHDQTIFGSVDQAFDMGAVGIGATIYFGSQESRAQIQEISAAFEHAHELGLFTVLWCYVRNPEFKVKGENYETAADLTGQANHLGVTIHADIIKQKLPTTNNGYGAVNFGKTHPAVYEKLTSDNPIDLTRYQVANSYMGRAGLVSSGGKSGENDIAQAVRSAVINKRAGGMGMIVGRKSFQRPMDEGVEIFNAIQDVYLDKSVTVA